MQRSRTASSWLQSSLEDTTSDLTTRMRVVRRENSHPYDGKVRRCFVMNAWIKLNREKLFWRSLKCIAVQNIPWIVWNGTRCNNELQGQLFDNSAWKSLIRVLKQSTKERHSRSFESHKIQMENLMNFLWFAFELDDCGAWSGILPQIFENKLNLRFSKLLEWILKLD